MKHRTLLSGLFLVALAGGCATAHVTTGRDFPIENVSQLVKGQSTAADLLRLFGEPGSKTVTSESEERWDYYYSDTTATAQSYIVAMSSQATTARKSLSVLLKNGIVSNYAYTKGPEPVPPEPVNTTNPR